MTSRPTVTVERARSRVATFDRIAAAVNTGERGLRRAAVCLAIVGEGETGVEVLLTMRSASLRGNPAQYALPGGKLDPDETVEQAALRELHEELGLRVSPVAVLGLLDDFVTVSGFVITPVVMWAGTPDPLTPNPDEVDEVYRVGLDELDVECRIIDSDVGPVFQWPFRGDYVHAPTAAILHQFREVVLHGRPTRVSHLGQPRFTWH